MNMMTTARRVGSRVADDVALLFDTLVRPFRGPRAAPRAGHFHICHTRHEHDRVYAENLSEYFAQVGVECKTVEFEAPRAGHFHICHTRHEHDRVYAENLSEYFAQVGVECKTFEFEAPGRWPGL